MTAPSRRIVIVSATDSTSGQLVRDEDAGDALGAELAQLLEQLLGIGLVERRRRLVEDQQLDVLGQRLGDLDELLLADPEPVDLRVGRLVEADLLEQPDRLLMGQAPVDDAACRLLVGQEDVLGDRQLRDQRQLLVDDDDALLLAVLDPTEVALLALVEELAVVRPVRVDAGHDLHQGGLAGTVLADQRVDLARANGEAHVLERLDARELLRDVAHLEQHVAQANRPSLSSALTGSRKRKRVYET